MLKDFAERPGEEHSAKAVVGQLFGMFSEITGAMVFPFLPPSVQGLGNFGGFQYELLDQTGGPIEDLASGRAQPGGAGEPDAGPRRRVHAVHRRRSAARRDDRSRAGEEPRHLAQRHHADDADSAGIDVRERLRLQQPVVSRLRAGRQPVPVEPGRHRALLGAQQRRSDDAAEQRRLDSRGHRAADHQPLQPVPIGHDQRVGGARLQLGPGAGRRWRRCRRACCRRG